jgi:hypothetical protein
VKGAHRAPYRAIHLAMFSILHVSITFTISSPFTV